MKLHEHDLACFLFERVCVEMNFPPCVNPVVNLATLTCGSAYQPKAVHINRSAQQKMYISSLEHKQKECCILLTWSHVLGMNVDLNENLQMDLKACPLAVEMMPISIAKTPDLLHSQEFQNKQIKRTFQEPGIYPFLQVPHWQLKDLYHVWQICI